MNTSERVAQEIKKSPIGKEDIARQLDVSWDTIHRWSEGKKKSYKKSEIESLSRILRVRYDYLMFGQEPKLEYSGLHRIESAVADKSKSYKGMDQTLLNVESKAKNLLFIKKSYKKSPASKETGPGTRQADS